MKKVSLKLIVSISGILLAVTMLLGASYAWLTVSVTPEVRGLVIQIVPTGKEVPFELSIDYDTAKENATWTTQLHLTDLIKNYTLRPISTADGEHWYLPRYNARGDINGFWEVDLADCANRANTEDNYLVYTDVWVRTRNEHTPQDMLLSYPISKVGDTENYYGSYVLWEPTWDEEGKLQQNDAMASLRIGFRFMEEDTQGSSLGKFYVYEPNADMRSDDFGETLQVEPHSQMGELTYIYTDPNFKNLVNKYQTSYTEGTYYSTLVPQYKADAPEGWTLVDLREQLGSRLITQKTSSWAEDTLKNGQKITSRNIDTIGKFGTFQADGSFAELAPVNGEALTTVTYGKVQKMRVYIWLEGQDIDCWNQIVEGNIYANLEFMGEPKVSGSASN